MAQGSLSRWEVVQYDQDVGRSEIPLLNIVKNASPGTERRNPSSTLAGKIVFNGQHP